MSLSSQRYYHGTSEGCAYGIAAQGFRASSERKPFLGAGAYISSSMETARLYGTVILEVALESGTRIVDLTPDPDPGVIAYLRREFGRDVLSGRLRRVVPVNKRLRQHELVEVVRHRWRAWYAALERPKPWVGWTYRNLHASLIDGLQALRRYGVEAAGDSVGEMGLVVMVPSRARALRVVETAELPPYLRGPSVPLGPMENLLTAPNAADLRHEWLDYVTPELSD